jgi:two-component system response regulator FixJ
MPPLGRLPEAFQGGMVMKPGGGRARPGSSASDSEPTVFVVDDDPAFLDLMRQLVESVRLRIETYETAQSFLDAFDPARPGCLVLDVRLPGRSGLDLQAELAARQATLPIIMISAYGEVPTAVRAMRAGALDFVQKPFDEEALLERIQEAIRTDQRAREIEGERAAVRARLECLTPRQRAVLDGLVAGKPGKVIADELGVSLKTVDVHRFRLMHRLKVQSLPELFRLMLFVRGEEP